MKSIGGMLMIVGGIFLFWSMFIFDTSVSVNGYGFGQRVNNLGLMNDKRNYITVSGIMFLAGLIMFMFDKIQKKVDYDADGSAEQFNGSKSKMSWSRLRDLKDDEYQIYLVKKYSIEKNDALGKIICNGKLFSNIEDALISMNKIDQLSSEGNSVAEQKIEIHVLPEHIKIEIQKLTVSLRKYGYEVTGYDSVKKVWEVSSSSGRFDQSLQELRNLLRNFE